MASPRKAASSYTYTTRYARFNMFWNRNLAEGDLPCVLSASVMPQQALARIKAFRDVLQDRIRSCGSKTKGIATVVGIIWVLISTGLCTFLEDLELMGEVAKHTSFKCRKCRLSSHLCGAHQVIVLPDDQPCGFGASRKRTEVALDMESAETEREASWTQDGLVQSRRCTLGLAYFIGIYWDVMGIKLSNTPTTAWCEW